MATCLSRLRVRLAVVALVFGLTCVLVPAAPNVEGRIRGARASALAYEQTDTAPRPVLEDLRGIDELKAMFNRDAGKHRLLLLLSPT